MSSISDASTQRSQSQPLPPPKRKTRRSPLVSKARSCFECRKAKLRCSREWPCRNCIRRGLQDSCSGIGPTGKDVTLQRPSQDESQLASGSTWPLAAATSGPSRQTDNQSDRQTTFPHQLEAFRPVLIERNGGTQYFGHAAHSSYLASSLAGPSQRNPGTARHSLGSTTGDSRHGRRSQDTPSPDAMHGNQDEENTDTDDVDHAVWAKEEIKRLKKRLPSTDRMQSILDTFRERIAWMYGLSDWTVQDLLPGSPTTAYNDEKVALCFAITAIVEACGIQRAKTTSYKNCWAALNAIQWTACNSLVVQQTFFLLCLFLLNFNGGQMSDRFTSVFGICVAKAIESGLHTDAQVSLDAAERRQRLFWQLYCLDAFRSLAYCRPCFFQAATITVKEPVISSDDDVFDSVKYATSRMISKLITNHLDSARSDFQETLKLDLQIRQLFDRTPAHLRVQKVGRIGADKQQSTRQVLQSCTIALNIHQTLLYLYRPWFVSATLEGKHSKDDQAEAARHEHYAQHQRSILCIGESARTMIELCCRAFSADAQTVMHWAFFLHHTFNAGVCRAIQALYGSATDPLYYDAKDDLDDAIALLSRTVDYGCEHVWSVKVNVLKKLRQSVDRGGGVQGVQVREEGSDSRRASNLGLLGAAALMSARIPDAERDTADRSAMDADAESSVQQHQMATRTEQTAFDQLVPPDLVSNNDDATDWLNLLNTDDFTGTMADLWSSQHMFEQSSVSSTSAMAWQAF